ncbi:hypothetical protein F5Y17DRAFT_379191 [Xylariaceae sp. FL0594]|nr:hypothetical protein F5Y17DRAFT_379191 [Xylariaceae sp. FL0594]
MAPMNGVWIVGVTSFFFILYNSEDYASKPRTSLSPVFANMSLQTREGKYKQEMGIKVFLFTGDINGVGIFPCANLLLARD